MSFWDGTRWVREPAPQPPRQERQHGLRDWLATGVMLLGVGLLLFPGMLSEAASPSLAVTPSVAAPGDAIIVSGRNFPARASVQLLLDGNDQGMPRTRTSKSGAFELRIRAPELTAGEHTLTALWTSGPGRSGSRESTAATFTMRVAASTPEAVALSATPDAETSAPDVTAVTTPTPATATSTPVPPASAAPPTAPTRVPTASPVAKPTSPIAADGAPAIPNRYGSMFRKDFSDGKLAPFRIITYPNDHPGDLMIQYGRFVTDSRHISVHDGYLDLRATRNADGSWSQAFVGTGLDGKGGTSNATFKFQYGTSRVMARMNSGPGAWQSIWYLVADSWGAPEIDWAEMIGGRLTANLHGSAADGQPGSLPAPRPDEWHEYGIVKKPGYVAFLYDGREVARANVAMSANVALLADAKVGLTPPSAATPELYLQIAWWTVDP